MPKSGVYSHRDEFGQWDPKNQRPELWGLYNARHRRGEHLRIFPLSNWTELDIWRFIDERQIDLPNLYFAHQREVFKRDGMLMAVNPWLPLIDGETSFVETVRFRTIGDATCTAAVASRPTPSPTSLPRPRWPGSPSAAPPVPTTRSAKPAWKTASARATSDHGEFVAAASIADSESRWGTNPGGATCLITNLDRDRCGSPRWDRSTTASRP